MTTPNNEYTPAGPVSPFELMQQVAGVVAYVNDRLASEGSTTEEILTTVMHDIGPIASGQSLDPRMCFEPRTKRFQPTMYGLLADLSDRFGVSRAAFEDFLEMQDVDPASFGEHRLRKRSR